MTILLNKIARNDFLYMSREWRDSSHLLLSSHYGSLWDVMSRHVCNRQKPKRLSCPEKRRRLFVQEDKMYEH